MQSIIWIEYSHTTVIAEEIEDQKLYCEDDHPVVPVMNKYFTSISPEIWRYKDQLFHLPRLVISNESIYLFKFI